MADPKPDLVTKAAAPKTVWKTDKTHIAVRTFGGVFWRTGRKFGEEATILAKADLTDADTASLINEKNLAVSEVDDPAKPAAPAK